MALALKIAALEDETDHIRVLDLVAQDGHPLPSYSAGAHLVFDLGDLGTRSYSLIDWPTDAASGTTYRIAVQREDAGDGGSQKMHALAVGDVVMADGPKNDFELIDTPAPVVLLAGGIGVTPLISMATKLAGAGRAFTFHYAARSRDVMGFSTKLETAFGSALRLAFDDTDPLNLQAVMAGLTPDTHLYICGPRGLIDAARTAATAAGLPDQQIRVELFATPETNDADTSFEVEISSTGQIFTIPPGQSIIDVLEAGGMDLIYDCQRGDCGICQTEVVSGIPDHRDVVLTQDEQSSGEVIQICVSRAKSPRLVLDL